MRACLLHVAILVSCWHTNARSTWEGMNWLSIGALLVPQKECIAAIQKARGSEDL